MRRLGVTAASLALLASHLLGSAAADENAGSSAEQLLVLTDGRVMRGQVHPHAIGYFLDRPGGSIVLPREQVRCVARDLPDAYRQQRERLVDPTAGELVELAEWCVSYRLYNEASDELRRALRREPENETARRLLARVEQLLDRPSVRTTTSQRWDQQGALLQDVESLGGLSRQSALQFTARIQPLLVNKCGNANCHGSMTAGNFRLAHIRTDSPNHRLGAQQNLALVLQYVNTDDPLRSPLLSKLDGAHGGAPLALFGGAGGAAQEQLLRDWVATVSQERRAEAEKLARANPWSRNKPRNGAVASTPPTTPAAAAATATRAEKADHLPTSTELSESPATVNANQEDGDASLPRRDRFDPEEFNRLPDRRARRRP